MNGVRENFAVTQSPAFWYDLPEGYLQLDVYPTGERIHELARQIRALPEDVRDRADQVFKLYVAAMWELQRQRVQGCALGMHPDDRGDVAMSVLTAFSVETQGVNPKAVLATLMASGGGETRDDGIVAVDLPCGPGFFTGMVRGSSVPEVPPEGHDDLLDASAWQGMVAIPDSRSSAIIAVQLVTPAVELADDYRNVLLGVASTVTFNDPSSGGVATGNVEPMLGSGAEAVRNDFG